TGFDLDSGRLKRVRLTMQYTKYASVEEARAAVRYPLLFPDEQVAAGLGLKGSSFERWEDGDTDLIAVMYIGLSRTGPEKWILDRMLFLTQGRGVRCEEPTEGAPPEQAGTFTLPDARLALWAVGLRDNGWRTDGPEW